MEIERINENTVKFYISYADIESRGFEREEIWYNRERSEQLFWQMMEEVKYKEDFPVEGPLWIQVQALDKGLEIIVTKAQISNEGTYSKLEDLFDLSEESSEDIEEDEKEVKDESTNFISDSNVHLITHFENFEDVIRLSYAFNLQNQSGINTKLFMYENKYYLYVEIKAELYEAQEDLFSQVLEFSEEAEVTTYILEEYGKVIFASNVFTNIRKHFNL